MGLNVLITGATGMVGKGVLLECLESPAVTSVIAVHRRPLGMTHPKLREILHTDFTEFSALEKSLAGIDACFFCLGVSSVGMKEADYACITYDVTLAFAGALARISPQAVFCYVTGAGTDSTEKGARMWARVKGRTENALLKLPFKAAYMFRPAFIRPMKGVRSGTWYQFFIVLLSPLFPLIEAFPKVATNSVKLGQAMINAALRTPEKRILESVDINRLSQT